MSGTEQHRDGSDPVSAEEATRVVDVPNGADAAAEQAPRTAVAAPATGPASASAQEPKPEPAYASASEPASTPAPAPAPTQAPAPAPAVERSGPRTGPIVWGALVLAFCVYVAQRTFGSGEVDTAWWITGTVIVLGALLLIVGIGVLFRSRDRL